MYIHHSIYKIYNLFFHLGYAHTRVIKLKNKNMNDIFDNEILCKKCKKIMKPSLISRNGFNLRVIKCDKCNEAIVHPADKAEYENFMRLKQKEFEVKMRMVGNSYAISIPREIVDFMREQEKMINDMVKLSFDNANSLSLNFNVPKMQENNPNVKSRFIQSKEVRVVRNNKPVIHARQFYDSAHPERSKNIILKSKNQKIEEEE